MYPKDLISSAQERRKKNPKAPCIHLLLVSSLASDYHQETITQAIELDFLPKTAKGNSRMWKKDPWNQQLFELNDDDKILQSAEMPKWEFQFNMDEYNQWDLAGNMKG